MRTRPCGGRFPLVSSRVDPRGESLGRILKRGAPVSPQRSQPQAGSRIARGEGAHALGPPSASHPLRPLLFPPLPPREKQPWAPGSPWHAVCEGQRTGCERGGQGGSGQLYWRWGHWRALSLEVREASAMGPWDPGAWAGKLRSWGAGPSSTGLEGASRVAEAR